MTIEVLKARANICNLMFPKPKKKIVNKNEERIVRIMSKLFINEKPKKRWFW